MRHDQASLARSSGQSGSRTSPRRLRSTSRLARDRGSRTPVPASVGSGIVYDYLSALDSPVALSVWMLYKAGDFRQIVEKTLDPHQYNCPERFRRDYAAVKFLSKCSGLKTGINTEEVAIEAARKAELQCKSTNIRIRGWRRGESLNLGPKLFRARSLIASILGPIPKSFSDVGWSNGRTSSSFGEELSATDKYGSRPDVTISARRRAVQLLQDCPLWGASVLNADAPCSVLSQGLNVVEGNVMLIVPKNAKTGRVICYEPHMNIRLQLAVGKFIRQRLFRAGVDLNDQTINQRRVVLGARFGHLSTIDLRSASDTLALELVWELLPVDWAIILDDLRSKNTLWPDGQWRTNEKFSSMGNGFTFELESLIFFALAKAVSDDGISVYGDDLIVPTNAFDEVVSFLEECGFMTNTSKSFKTSYFRESCGMDRFGSVDVTPVYLRSLPKRVGDIVKLHNAWRSREGTSACPSRRVERILASWRDTFPSHHGPSGYGDGHYHVDFDTATPRASDGLDGWWFKTTIPVFGSRFEEGGSVSGQIPDRLGYAALCAATGPKRTFSLWDTLASRRQARYKTIRVLASFHWPSVLWV